MKKTRNFCIIAHIDHGKSTLADRMLEITNTLTARDMENQVLDSMDLEKEKGITIKSHAIQMDYMYNGEKYTFNLIDTPGHVDFSYEVSRAIASCEGALLVVDATQGIQAQTISNLYLAIEHDLEIIPVLNKIDVDSAMVDVVTDQVVDLLGCKPEEAMLIGDQIFTDCIAAHRAGIRFALVKPIQPVESKFFRMKRFFERPFVRKLDWLNPKNAMQKIRNRKKKAKDKE